MNAVKEVFSAGAKGIKSERDAGVEPAMRYIYAEAKVEIGKKSYERSAASNRLWLLSGNTGVPG